MILAIEYMIQKNGVGEGFTTLRDDGDRLVEAAIWFTGQLCLHFSSIDDINRTIIGLQKLRKEVIDHMNKTNHQFIPDVRQSSNNPTINILIHEPEKLEITTSSLEKRNLDMITLYKGGDCDDLDYQSINICVPSGQAKSIGRRIVASVNNEDKGGS